MSDSRPNKNPRASDRYDKSGFKWAQHQVVNKFPGKWDFCVVKLGKSSLPIPGTEYPEYDDARVVTYAEGTRHVAAGRKAVLERHYDNDYEVRAYQKD
jgi:hypothetical protein